MIQNSLSIIDIQIRKTIASKNHIGTWVASAILMHKKVLEVATISGQTEVRKICLGIGAGRRMPS